MCFLVCLALTFLMYRNEHPKSTHRFEDVETLSIVKEPMVLGFTYSHIGCNCKRSARQPKIGENRSAPRSSSLVCRTRTWRGARTMHLCAASETPIFMLAIKYSRTPRYFQCVSRISQLSQLARTIARDFPKSQRDSDTPFPRPIRPVVMTANIKNINPSKASALPSHWHV